MQIVSGTDNLYFRASSIPDAESYYQAWNDSKNRVVMSVPGYK
jgi:antibiotic biosynthesis monooxygenase (ABM) superfamily enzyme